jgi:2-methylisocitrate lyase-like PEP mutase family enzyme
VFVPGVTDPDEIRALCGAIPVPVNVLVVPDLSLEQTAALGVRRVSTGSLPYVELQERLVRFQARRPSSGNPTST